MTDVSDILNDFDAFKDLAKSLTVKYSKIDGLEVSDDTLVENLGLESLDVMEIIFDVERELGILIDDRMIGEMKTFGDLCKYMFESHTKKGA